MISLPILFSNINHHYQRITLQCLNGNGLYGTLSGNGLCLGAIMTKGLEIILRPLVAT